MIMLPNKVWRKKKHLQITASGTTDLVIQYYNIFCTYFLQNEAAFSFKKSSRCLVVPLDTTIFSDSPGNMELKAAKFSMNGKVWFIYLRCIGSAIAI